MNTLQNTGWITRIFVALVTTALVILGFFFLTIALIAGAIVAAVFGVRLWWTLLKLKRAQANGAQAPVDGNVTVVEGDYQVIEREGTVRLPPK